MTTLSSSAKSYLVDLLSTNAIEGEHVIRIERGTSTWVLKLGRIRDDDEVVEHNGQPLLAYSTVHAEVLEDVFVDYRGDGSEGRLVLTEAEETD